MANTVDYYLSKGFDRLAAEYFASGRKRIIGVSANDDFTRLIDSLRGHNVTVEEITNHVL